VEGGCGGDELRLLSPSTLESGGDCEGGCAGGADFADLIELCFTGLVAVLSWRLLSNFVG